MWEAVAGLFKMGVGMWQTAEAERYKKEAGDRPEYKTPVEVRKSTELAKINLFNKSKDWENSALDEIDMGATMAYDQAKATGNPLGAIAGIQGAQQKGYANIALLKQQQEERLAAIYSAELKNKASYTDTEFQLNKWGPYADAMDESQKKQAAGLENLYGGLSDVGQIVDALMGFGGETNETGSSDKKKKKKKKGTNETGSSDQ